MIKEEYSEENCEEIKVLMNFESRINLKLRKI